MFTWEVTVLSVGLVMFAEPLYERQGLLHECKY